MALFYAFIGLWAGLFLSGGYEPSFVILLALLCLGLGFFAYRKGALWPYAIALALGIGLGCLRFWVIPFSGNGPFLVYKAGNGYVFVTNFVSRFYLTDKEGAYEVGDILRISGGSQPFKATTYESRFSFPLYLQRLGIAQEIVPQGYPQFAFRSPLRFRSWENHFLSSFEKETASLLGKLLFARSVGESEALDAAKEMGILFALSTSGFFLGRIIGFIKRLLSYKFSPRVMEIAGVVVLSLFLPLAFRKVGILRLWLGSILALALPKITKKRWQRLDLIALSGLIILGLDFHYAYQTGFILGFGLSLFFLFACPITSRFKGLKKKAVSYGLLRFLLLPVSLSAGSLHPLGILFSLLIIPWSILLMGIGYFSYLTFPFTHVLNGMSGALSSVTLFLSKMDFEIGIPSLSKTGILLFICITIIILITYFLRMKKSRQILAISTLGIYLFTFIPSWHFATSEVCFINVGQGDCILLRSGVTTVMMDTGGVLGFDIAKETVIPYLRKRRIYHIDALIASHGDYDHVGGVPSLMANYPVRKYVTSASEFPLRVGSLTFENYNHYGGKDENDRSLVLSTYVGGRSYLLTGDAPKEVERKIIQEHPSLRCDILKVGHHGSSTSSCAEFLDCLRPKEAVVSCGARNKYGHPNADVVARLSERNITIRRTDIEGTIVYYGLP